MWDAVYPYLAALIPTIGLLIIVYVVFRTIFEADRKERRAVALWEAQRDREAGRPPSASDSPGADTD